MLAKVQNEYMVICGAGSSLKCAGQSWTGKAKSRDAERAVKAAGWVERDGGWYMCPACANVKQ